MEASLITPEELEAYVAAIEGAFHHDPRPEDVERIRKKLELDRSLVIRDDGRIVATTSIYTREMTVPGGVRQVAGVTQVGVLPSHRRRGLLTALMRQQLSDIRERGEEAFAALWASEPAIYGRFGYGMASLVAELDVTTRDARLRAAPDLRAELRTPADAIDAMRAIYDAARPDRPGMLTREGPWWDGRTHDDPEDRDGYSPLRAAVIPDAAYAMYAVKGAFEHGRPEFAVYVREAVAATPDGQAAIWAYLLGLDLTSRLKYELAASDDPLPHLLVSSQSMSMRVGDALWVRLVDLPRALRERTYGEPFEVVFDVEDELCPWNAGRYALRWDGEDATCAPTAVAPTLELGVAELGAVYLGGTTLDELARAGRVRELRGGVLTPASRAFRGDRAPWCPEIF